MSITQFHNLQEKLFKYRILKNSAMQSQLTRLKTDEEYYKKHTAILKLIYDNVLSYYGVDGNELDKNYVDMLFAKRIDRISSNENLKFLDKCEPVIKDRTEDKCAGEIISYQWLKMRSKNFWYSGPIKLTLDSFITALKILIRNYFAILKGTVSCNRKKYEWKI